MQPPIVKNEPLVDGGFKDGVQYWVFQRYERGMRYERGHASDTPCHDHVTLTWLMKRWPRVENNKTHIVVSNDETRTCEFWYPLDMKL
jgi:hypothetical protein